MYGDKFMFEESGFLRRDGARHGKVFSVALLRKDKNHLIGRAVSRLRRPETLIKPLLKISELANIILKRDIQIIQSFNQFNVVCTVHHIAICRRTNKMHKSYK